MATMMIDPQYRYDEAKMLEGIAAFRREQKCVGAPKILRRAAEARAREAMERAELEPDEPMSAAEPVAYPVRERREPISHHDAQRSWSGLCCGLVCDEYDMGLDELTAISNERRFVRPRQVAMYLMVRVVGATLTAVGAELGGMHHTSVIHGVRVIEKVMAADAAFEAMIIRLAAEAGVVRAANKNRGQRESAEGDAPRPYASITRLRAGSAEELAMDRTWATLDAAAKARVLAVMAAGSSTVCISRDHGLDVRDFAGETFTQAQQN